MKIDNEIWYGVDVDLEISLFEYGILTSKDNKISIIGVGKKDDSYNQFITTNFTDENIKETINERSFSKKGFFSYLGTKEVNWLKLAIPIKLRDLVSYYNWDNFFSSEIIMSKKETEQFINNYKLENNGNETVYTSYTE